MELNEYKVRLTEPEYLRLMDKYGSLSKAILTTIYRVYEEPIDNKSSNYPMSKISLSPEQYDLLKKGGMQNFFKEISEDLYEIVPLHAQFEDDEDFCDWCYEREQREKAMHAACNVPVKSLQELFDNADKIRKWVEGDI